MTSAGHLLTAISMACIAALPGKAAAEPLGRLFFTPERRAVLERQRQTGSSEQEIFGTALTLDGIVAGPDGKATVWINNRPQHWDMAGTGVRAAVTARDPQRATLTTAEDAAITLRVGESIDRASRQKTDVLLPDALRVNHPARIR